SLFHISLGISYPFDADMAFALGHVNSRGGDIFIPGGPRMGIDPMNKRDWTAGCISVTDRQIEDIYAMVRDGTPIDIYA
ncbi:MAG: L,D-transpeptidase, partial [Alphaproteobacteria bacterium]